MAAAHHSAMPNHKSYFAQRLLSLYLSDVLLVACLFEPIRCLHLVLVLSNNHKIMMLKYKRCQCLVLRIKGYIHILILWAVLYLAALSLIVKQNILLLYSTRDTAPPCLLSQCITNKPIAALLHSARPQFSGFFLTSCHFGRLSDERTSIAVHVSQSESCNKPSTSQARDNTCE